MNTEFWNFVNSFAPWFSAVGTIAAVIVSLYLANRDRRIRLRIRGGLRTIIFSGQSVDQGTEVIMFSVTNVGYRATKINSIHWKTGILKKTLAIQIPDDNPYSARLPIKLSDGDVADFPIPSSKFEIAIFRESLSPRFLRLQVKFIKVGVLTTTGKFVTSTIEKGLQNWFLKQLAR